MSSLQDDCWTVTAHLACLVLARDCETHARSIGSVLALIEASPSCHFPSTPCQFPWLLQTQNCAASSAGKTSDVFNHVCHHDSQCFMTLNQFTFLFQVVPLAEGLMRFLLLPRRLISLGISRTTSTVSPRSDQLPPRRRPSHLRALHHGHAPPPGLPPGSLIVFFLQWLTRRQIPVHSSTFQRAGLLGLKSRSASFASSEEVTVSTPVCWRGLPTLMVLPASNGLSFGCDGVALAPTAGCSSSSPSTGTRIRRLAETSTSPCCSLTVHVNLVGISPLFLLSFAKVTSLAVYPLDSMRSSIQPPQRQEPLMFRK